MAMHTELWFPSVVWSQITHVVNNQALKHFAYERKQNDVGVKHSNVGGYQSDSLRAGDHPEIDRLARHLETEISNCTKQTGLFDLELYNMWLNINPPGAYNEAHHHIGAVLTGVYYVDAHEGQGAIQFDRSDNAEYHIPEYVEKETYFTSTRAKYAAKTGALYIFPAWLKHSVQGNTSNTDRISISFNYGVKR
jgi:uncharacterized protein (TIGR02466 family)